MSILHVPNSAFFNLSFVSFVWKVTPAQLPATLATMKT